MPWDIQPRRCIPGIILHRFQNVPPRPQEHDANVSFELTGYRGAALATRHETRREDTLSERLFETYTKRHYRSWVEFVHHKRYGDDICPFLVSGFDMTKDYSLVAYFNRTNRFESNDTIAIPMFASPSSFQGTWYARHMVYTAKGPEPRVADPISSQSGDGGSVANGFDQCVFIRYYTMRWRKRCSMFSKAMLSRCGGIF